MVRLIETKPATISHRIIDILSRERLGLTAKELTKKLQPFYQEELNYREIHVIVSANVNKGYLYTDGQRTCPHCGSFSMCYRISTKGREYLIKKKENGYEV